MVRLAWLGKKIEPLRGFKEQNEPVYVAISSEFCPQ